MNRRLATFFGVLAVLAVTALAFLVHGRVSPPVWLWLSRLFTGLVLIGVLLTVRAYHRKRARTEPGDAAR